jgi:hypothetical protein
MTRRRSPLPDGKLSDLAKKLKLLVEKCGGDLELFEWGTRDFAGHFERAARDVFGIPISETVIKDIVQGRTTRLQEPTRSRLTRLFQKSRPALTAVWWDFDYEKFATRLDKAEPGRQPYEFSAPVYKGDHPGALNPSALADWLNGYYVSYRYSYEESSERKIAREVLHLFQVDGSFRFRLWYSRGGSNIDRKIETFNGVIVPIGRSLFFTGVSEDRGRTIIMRQEKRRGSLQCRIGIMTSCKVQNDAEPVSACVVMLKLQVEPDAKEWQSKYCALEAGVVGVFEKRDVLRDDFPGESQLEYTNGLYSEKHTFHDWMTTFIDNKPLTPDTHTNRDDSVLRLHLDRFYHVMPQIQSAILRDVTCNVPFTSRWNPKPQPLAAGVVDGGPSENRVAERRRPATGR